MEDREIVELLLARNPTAVQEAQAKYGKKLERLARRILYDPRDVEECVNDTLMQMWNAIPPHEPASLSAFLYVITRQGALDRLRRQSAEKRGGTAYELSLDELAEHIAGESEADTDGLTDAINQYLCTLAPPMRAVFLRRYFAAESIWEIATALQFSEAKIKSMLFRARKGLRNYLKQEGFDL